jgi:pimeloyl-ACP methyl ester carboxylesterase
VLLAVMPPELPVALGLGFEAKDFSKVRQADVAAYAAPLSSLAGQHALIASAAHLKSEGAERLIAGYGQIRQPTLVMTCLDDGIVPPSTAVRLSRTLPRGQLRLLDGCRHLAPEQTPDAVSAGIAAFLTQR